MDGSTDIREAWLMAFYFSCGPLFNLLARGTVTCNPAASAILPLARAYDDLSDMFAWGSLAADSYIQLRNNPLVNPGAEVAFGTEWVDADTGTGVATRGAPGTGRGGGAECAFSIHGGAAGVSRWYQRIECPAGELGRIDGWIKPGAGAGLTGGLSFYCEETAQWYTGGAWGAAEGDAVSVVNNAAFVRVAETLIQLPTMATALWSTVHIRVGMRTASNAAVLVDDVAWIPAVNGVVIHGHNFRPCLTPTLRYSDDAFGADDNVAATMTLARPSFYSYLAAPVYREYWRLKLAGTNTEIPRLTEAWFGYWSTLSASADDGWSISRMSAADSDSGDAWSRVRVREEQPRTLKMDFTRVSEAEWLEIIRDLDERTGGGCDSLVCVPESTSNEARCIYGKLDPVEMTLARQDPSVWKIAGLTISEMPVSRMLP
jgi:hypothetical protein